jgi:hypothetical protein
MMLGPLIAISPTTSVPSARSSRTPGSGLISFISTPGIGLPIDPTRAGSPQTEKLATGEVSDRP